MSLVRAFMTNDPTEREALLDYEVLKFVVQSKIFDDITGTVLDVRSAVVVRYLNREGHMLMSFAISTTTWNEHKTALRHAAETRNLEMQVIHGGNYTAKGTLRKRRPAED